jgi:hypothetical protein
MMTDEPETALRLRPSLRAFVFHRLGNPDGPWPAAKSMFARSFGAKSFAAFWRYWNPVYHYYLYYWCYRPLRTFLPRPIAVLLTFAVCGFLLHDLPLLPFTGVPLITIWFLLLGVGVIASEQLRMDLSRHWLALRVVVNVVYLVGLLEVARRLSLQLFRA